MAVATADLGVKTTKIPGRLYVSTNSLSNSWEAFKPPHAKVTVTLGRFLHKLVATFFSYSPISQSALYFHGKILLILVGALT